DRDVVEACAELRGGDLRERGRVALSLRDDADQHVHLAARIHAHGRALERAEAGALEIARDADPEPRRRPALRDLALAPLLVAEPREHRFERSGEIAGVVADRYAVLVRETRRVRHLLRPDEIAPAHVDGIEPELARADIDEALHHERRLRTSRGSIRRVERLVRDEARAAVPVVPYTVRRTEMVYGVRRQAVALRRIRADVGEERAIDGDDGAVAGEADGHVVLRPAVLV